MLKLVMEIKNYKKVIIRLVIKTISRCFGIDSKIVSRKINFIINKMSKNINKINNKISRNINVMINKIRRNINVMINKISININFRIKKISRNIFEVKRFLSNNRVDWKSISLSFIFIMTIPYLILWGIYPEIFNIPRLNIWITIGIGIVIYLYYKFKTITNLFYYIKKHRHSNIFYKFIYSIYKLKSDFSSKNLINTIKIFYVLWIFMVPYIVRCLLINLLIILLIYLYTLCNKNFLDLLNTYLNSPSLESLLPIGSNFNLKLSFELPKSALNDSSLLNLTPVPTHCPNVLNDLVYYAQFMSPGGGNGGPGPSHILWTVVPNYMEYSDKYLPKPKIGEWSFDLIKTSFIDPLINFRQMFSHSIENSFTMFNPHLGKNSIHTLPVNPNPEYYNMWRDKHQFSKLILYQPYLIHTTPHLTEMRSFSNYLYKFFFEMGNIFIYKIKTIYGTLFVERAWVINSYNHVFVFDNPDDFYIHVISIYRASHPMIAINDPYGRSSPIFQALLENKLYPFDGQSSRFKQAVIESTIRDMEAINAGKEDYKKHGY